MLKLKQLNDNVSIAKQMDSTEAGPVVLINVFTVAKGDEEALTQAWKEDAAFMRKQPGFISTQLHKGIAGSGTFFNYAVWENVLSFRNAFSNPEFQKGFARYPDSAVASPHLFKKMAVPGHCVA